MTAGVALVAAGVAPMTAAAQPKTSSSASHCLYRQLRITTGQADGATGHLSFRVHFTNHSHKTCTLYGYPGVEALNSHGRPNMEAKRTKDGFMGGVGPGHKIQTATLAHGQVATAIVEGTDVPTGNKKSCPQAVAFRITPPNDGIAKLVERTMPECSRIQVHPVVKGRTGQRQG